MASRIATVRNAVVARIQEGWSGSPATVSTVPAPDLENDRSPGRRVFVLMDGYADGGPVTREADRTLYRVRVVVTELYLAGGSVTDAWLDARLDWVKTETWDKLTDPRNPLTLTGPAGEAVPEAADQTALYDADRLRSDKRFVTETVFTFRVEE